MSLKKSLLLTVLPILAAAAPSFAGQTSTALGQPIRLNCPQGTTQKGDKVSKDSGVFCVKPGAGKEFKLHGPYVDFWPNGQKQSEGAYQEGFQVGLWSFWNTEGVKTSEIEFVRGNYHGKRVLYFSNGKPRIVEEYANGKRNGLVQEFSEDGKLVRQAQYRDDKQVAEK